MKYCLSLSIVGFFFVFSLICSTTQTEAVDVAWEGYFRARGNMFYNLDLDRDQTPQMRNFTDMRFRVNPSFFISDKVRVRSSLNFFDGVLGQHPLRRNAYNNPALTNSRLLDPAETNTVVGRPDVSDLFISQGGATSPEGMTDSTQLTPLYLRRVWGEFDMPYGTIKIGRMPNNFGLGIFANAGDDPDQENGSSRDRIMFDTSFGPYYVRPGAGWLVEGALDRGQDDFLEYFFIFGRKNEIQDIGMYLSFNQQNRSTNALGTEGESIKTAYWAFDFYFQNQFDPVNLSTEVVLISGKYVGKNILALNAAARAEFKFGDDKWKLLIEPGYSSGTSESDLLDGDIKTFAFSRDYDVSLLVFEEALPGGRATKNSAGTVTAGATAPHSGAISNAMYGRIKLSLDAASFFKPSLNIIAPFAAKLPKEAGGRFYGVEYDLLTDWPFMKYWSAQFALGHFIPGSFYDKISRSHSAMIVRGGITAQF